MLVVRLWSAEFPKLKSGSGGVPNFRGTRFSMAITVIATRAAGRGDAGYMLNASQLVRNAYE